MGKKIPNVHKHCSDRMSPQTDTGVAALTPAQKKKYRGIPLDIKDAMFPDTPYIVNKGALTSEKLARIAEELDDLAKKGPIPVIVTSQAPVPAPVPRDMLLKAHKALMRATQIVRALEGDSVGTAAEIHKLEKVSWDIQDVLDGKK